MSSNRLPIPDDLLLTRKLLLSIRYYDTTDLLQKEVKNNEIKNLANTCKSLLLGYGLTHAGRENKNNPHLVLRDPYIREGIETTKFNESLLYHIVNIILNEMIKQDKVKITERYDKLFLPISNIPLLKQMLGKSYEIMFDGEDEIEIAGKKIHLVRLKQNMCKPAFKIVGQTGEFINKDLQLWILANIERSSESDFLDFFETISTQETTQRYYQTSVNSINDIKENILKNLLNNESIPIQYLKSLIENIEITSNQPDIATQIHRAFSRLEYILENAENHSCHHILLEFAFDEIILLNSLNPVKSETEIETILKKFIKTQNIATDSIEISVNLHSSGMNSLLENLSTCISEIQSTIKNENIRIYFSHESYYETNLGIRRLVSAEILEKIEEKASENELYITISSNKNKTGISSYDHKTICDIIVSEFVSSVSTIVPKHEEYQVEKLIEQQLYLRRIDKSKGKQHHKLVVLLDTTMNQLDDNQVALLIERFQKEIKFGQLAIITIHSLNKYFHVGFDKLPAGLTAGFYNKKSFSTLNIFHSKNIIKNYDFDNPTPQMIATILKNPLTIEAILAYHHRMKFIAKDIYSKCIKLENNLYPIIPKELISHNTDDDNDKEISIYSPTIDLFQTWGFIVIKTKTSTSYNYILNVLEDLGIEWRGGYGYANTTYCKIPNTSLIRISIGCDENHNLIKTKCYILGRYACEINQLISQWQKDQPTYLLCFAFTIAREKWKAQWLKLKTSIDLSRDHLTLPIANEYKSQRESKQDLLLSDQNDILPIRRIPSHLSFLFGEKETANIPLTSTQKYKLIK